jgi:hypothetical protein
MDPFEAAIYTRLTADATLMALTGDRTAYCERAPQEASTPLVVFQLVSGLDIWSFGDSIENHIWLVKAIDRGRSAGNAGTIAARINTVLNDAELTIDGYASLFLRRVSKVSYPENDGAETYWHRGAQYRLFASPS